MNIYITKLNQDRLRASGESMSGLVNKLLDDFFESESGFTVSKEIIDRVPSVKKVDIKLESTPTVDNGLMGFIRLVCNLM